MHSLTALNITGDISTPANTFNVLSTAPSVQFKTIFGKIITYSTTTIINSKGPDIVNVGDSTGVEDIKGRLIINGSGATKLSLNDQPDTTSRTVTVTSSKVTGLAPAEIDYANLASLTISGGNSGNTINVLSTAAGTATTINGGAAANKFEVGSDGTFAGSTAGIVSSVTLNGGSSNQNPIILDDSGRRQTFYTANLTPTSASGFFGAGGSLT